MSKGCNFFVSRLLLLVSIALTAECSNETSYYVMAESTLMYYDMSTVVISSTAAASSLVSTAIMTNTPSPTSNIEPPDMEEMENNAVIMAFNNLTLLQWMQLEDTLLSIIAYECTRQCAIDNVDCGTRSNVNYTSDDIVILPGYPKIVDNKLLVAFSVSLPSSAVHSDNTSVIDQDILFNIAAAASAAITAQTGVEVHEVGRYTAPNTATDNPESSSNLALILSLTLIFGAIFISVVAGVGSFYAWKMAKKHKSLDLVKKSLKTEQVELRSYKATAYNNSNDNSND